MPTTDPYAGIFDAAGKRVVADGKAASYEYTFSDYASYSAKLKTSAAAVPPSVAQMLWDGNYHAMIEANLLEPLDSLLPDLPKFDAGVLEQMKFNGKTYAVPMDVNTLSIGYNKAIFAKLGLSVPTTFDELLALNKPLRDAGYEPLALPLKQVGFSYDTFLAMLAYTDPTDTALRQAEQGEVAWNSEPFLRAAEMVQQLQESGLLIEGAPSLNMGGAVSVFGSQKAAMMYAVGNYLFKALDDAIDGKFEYDMFAFPPPDAGTKPRATGGPAILWSVPTKAKDKDGAYDYLKKVTDEKSAALMLKDSYIPAFPSDVPTDADPLFQRLLELQPGAGSRVIFDPKVFAALVDSVTQLLSGKSSAQQLVDDLQSAAA
ncbi:MAG: extracellular solute-binding protein [Conexibacter sp.]